MQTFQKQKLSRSHPHISAEQDQALTVDEVIERANKKFLDFKEETKYEIDKSKSKGLLNLFKKMSAKASTAKKPKPVPFGEFKVG